MRLSALEISRLEEARAVAGLRESAAESVEIAGGIACYSGPGSWCNMAAGLGMSGPVTEHDLDRLDAFFRDHGVSGRVELSPYAHAALAPALARRGFGLVRFENLLAAELSPDDPPAPGPLGPEGLELRLARGGEEELFVRTAASGFMAPDQPIPEGDLAVGLRMVAHPAVISVLALLDGAAIGAASAEVRGPICALFGASVRPAWRGKGVHGAMLQARLTLARARGASLATIGSMPGEPTERTAARAGFRVVCTRAHLER